MKQLNQLQATLHQAKCRLLQCSSLADVYSFIIRMLSVSFGKFFNSQRLISYDLKLSSEFAYRKLSKYSDGEKYNFNGIYLPAFSMNDYRFLYSAHIAFLDIFSTHLLYNDNYSYVNVDKLDKRLTEGVYCYQGPNGEDITIHRGDVVLDLGACIGEFSAYAAKKGAIVYAFEPSSVNRVFLKKTVEYNNLVDGRIIIIPYGVGSKNGEINFLEGENHAGSSGFNDADATSAAKVRIVRLDDWITDKNIKINFIKADIEGFERHMLEGAVSILKTHQPVLSLCTYHLPDDPEVMKEIILKANPNYKIIQRRMKMFAYVPDGIR